MTALAVTCFEADQGRRLAAKPANALAAIRRCLVDGGAMAFADGLAATVAWYLENPDWVAAMSARYDRGRLGQAG